LELDPNLRHVGGGKTTGGLGTGRWRQKKPCSVPRHDIAMRTSLYEQPNIWNCWLHVQVPDSGVVDWFCQSGTDRRPRR